MKFVKRLFLILLLLLLVAVSGIMIAAHYYGDEIKAFVVENLNKHLKTEVKVSNVEFSVWENFPSASIVFSDVVIYAVNAKNDSLLSAKKLSATFNLKDLYQEQYKLIGLTVEDGICKMQVDNSGYSNYIFWNEADSASSASFSVELEKVSLKKMNYTYVDYSRDSEFSFLIEEADINGNFEASIFDLRLNTKLENTKIKFGKTELFENRTLYLLVDGNVNQAEERLNFTDANLGVDDMNIAVNGFLDYGKASKIDLHLKSSNTDLDKTIALLPASVRNYLSRFKIRGAANFDGRINGPLSNTPHYNFNFEVKEGTFSDKDSELSFTESSLSGSVTNGKNRNNKSTRLELNSFKTNLQHGIVDGTLNVVNFDQPEYNYKGNLTFELSEAVDFFKWKDLLNPTGSVSAALSIQGKLATAKEYTAKDWKKSKVDGTVQLHDIGFSLKNSPQQLSSINGQLNFNNNSILIDLLTATIDDNSLELKGKLNNLIAYLMNDKEPLFIDAQLYSPKVNLAQLLASNESSEEEESYALDISPRLTVYADIKVDQLHFNQFELDELKSVLVIKKQRIDARGVSFNSQEGKVKGDLFIRENQNNSLTLFSQGELAEVNIRKLFKSFNNFGQSTLKAENLSGIANVDFRFNSVWSKQLEIDQKSIKMDASFTIDNGKLIDFKTLESLSRFVELEELKEVKFKRLHNQLLIENELITVPRFDVLSSALNLSVAGTHSFDNEIDYHITLLLSELLSRKAKKPKESEFGYVEEDGLKGSKLFLKMTGTVDDPSIAYDTKALKSTLKKKFIQEKNTFKALLKEEFGLFKNDSSLKPEPQPQRKQSPFQIEIDSSLIKKKDKEKDSNQNTNNESNDSNKDNDSKNKSKFGKFLDKIAKPNEEEFVEPIEN